MPNPGKGAEYSEEEISGSDSGTEEETEWELEDNISRDEEDEVEEEMLWEAENKYDNVRSANTQIAAGTEHPDSEYKSESDWLVEDEEEEESEDDYEEEYEANHEEESRLDRYGADLQEDKGGSEEEDYDADSNSLMDDYNSEADWLVEVDEEDNSGDNYEDDDSEEEDEEEEDEEDEEQEN